MVESVKLDAKARNEYHFLFNRYPDFILKAMKEGEQKGIEKGREEERFFMARSFRNMGFPLDKIAEATGLSEDEITSL